MKKLVGVSIVVFLLGIIVITGCRPPELEGVVVNMQHGLYDKAFDLAKEAVQKYPNNPEAWYLLGELYGRKDQFVEMNDAFDKSLAISPQYKPDIERLRFNYFAENYNDALKNYYNKARDTQDPELQKKLFQKAAEKFLKAHQADPEKVEPLTPMSVSFLEVGDTTEAEKYLLQAVQGQPKDDTLMVSVGDFYFKTDQYDKAEDMYQKALAVNPNNTQAHLALGEIYVHDKDWEKAIGEFNVGMEQQPNNSAIPMNIGIIYYNDQMYEKAIPYLKKSLELDPNNKDVEELLSISYLQQAQKYQDEYTDTQKEEYKQKYEDIYNMVLPMLEQAVQKFPNSALLWNNLGVVYAQKGMKDKAEQAFEKQKELEANK
ncbi:MAG: tetratricopeptide repeat protein [Calditrichia bacterium]